MALLAEPAHEKTKTSAWHPSMAEPLDEDMIPVLDQALAHGEIKNVSDIVQLLGLDDDCKLRASASENDSLGRYVFTDRVEKAYESILLGRMASLRLRELLASNSGMTNESFLEHAILVAYEVAKEEESSRIVPFGVRLSTRQAGGFVDPMYNALTVRRTGPKKKFDGFMYDAPPDPYPY